MVELLRNSLILVLLLRFARQEWAAFTLRLIISHSWVKELLSTLLDAPWILRLFTPLGGNGRCILPGVCSGSSCFWFFPPAALHPLENVLNSMTSLSYNCTCLTKPHSESVWGSGSLSLYLCPWKKIKQWHIQSWIVQVNWGLKIDMQSFSMSLDPSPNFCQSYFQPSPFSSTLPSTNTHTCTHTHTDLHWIWRRWICHHFHRENRRHQMELLQLLTTTLTKQPWFTPPEDRSGESDWERSLWQWLLKTISPHLSEGWTNQLGETKGTWTFVHCHQRNQIGSWLPHLGWAQGWSNCLLGILFSPWAFKVNPTFSCGFTSPILFQGMSLSLTLICGDSGCDPVWTLVNCLREEWNVFLKRLTMLWNVPWSLPLVMPWPHVEMWS